MPKLASLHLRLGLPNGGRAEIAEVSEQPHWEHGYRCHGYWLGEDRLGACGIGPPGFWTPAHGYSWIVQVRGYPWIEGYARTLRTAKRRVERAATAYLERSKDSAPIT